MNRVTSVYLCLLAFFFNSRGLAQLRHQDYPSLDSSYGIGDIANFAASLSTNQNDTIGLVYIHAAILRSEESSIKQKTEALHFFLEFNNTLTHINLKDACKIRLTIIHQYVGAEKKIVTKKLSETDDIINICRKNNWGVLCVEAYLLKFLLMNGEEWDAPYPEELISVYHEFKAVIQQDISLNTRLTLLLGKKYQQYGDLSKAAVFYENGLNLAQTQKHQFAVNLSKLFLAQIYRLQGRAPKAKILAQEVLKHCIEGDDVQDTDLSRWASEELAFISKDEGNYKKSVFYWEIYDTKVKTLKSKNNASAKFQPSFIQKVQKDLAEKKIREDLQQKLVEETNRKNILLLFTIVIVLLLSAILFFITNRWYKQRRKHLLKENEIAITTCREEERETIARELHDHVGNTLISVKNAIPQNIKNYEKITEAIGEIYDVIRQSSHALSTAGLSTVGLVESCKDYIQLIDKEQIIKMAVVGNDTNIPLNLSKEAFRITQEIIQNTLKYSKATEINFTLLIKPEILTLNFEDDGVGFEPIQANNGIGLKNIEARVKRLGGKLSFDTSPTYGTSFWIDLPIQD